MEHLYHVVAISERYGYKVFMTKYPVPHKEACVIMSKITKHQSRRIQLEEVSSV